MIRVFGRCSALGAESPERDIVLGDQESGGEFPSLLAALGKSDVGDMTAFRAVEVTVLLEVRTKSGWLTVNMDGLHQTASNHRFKAVIHSGERDGGHLLLSPDKDLRGRRMIPLVHEHLIDLTPLRRKAQTSLYHGRRIVHHRAFVGWNG